MPANKRRRRSSCGQSTKRARTKHGHRSGSGEFLGGLKPSLAPWDYLRGFLALCSGGSIFPSLSKPWRSFTRLVDARWAALFGAPSAVHDESQLPDWCAMKDIAYEVRDTRRPHAGGAGWLMTLVFETDIVGHRCHPVLGTPTHWIGSAFSSDRGPAIMIAALLHQIMSFLDAKSLAQLAATSKCVNPTVRTYARHVAQRSCGDIPVGFASHALSVRDRPARPNNTMAPGAVIDDNGVVLCRLCPVGGHAARLPVVRGAASHGGAGTAVQPTARVPAPVRQPRGHAVREEGGAAARDAAHEVRRPSRRSSCRSGWRRTERSVLSCLMVLASSGRCWWTG